ncbi:NYN domain-containing protein [Arenicella sp. 4NH20-0111]|uniref:LabA-like NYN domain-containing protein n=1 Tax=Arenicella sp. 4NH20-0111 TaxID=3127648 RepID=UPI003107D12F
MNNAVVLVDVQNIYYTTKQAHQCNFDYNYFWQHICREHTVFKAIAYTTDRQDEKQRQFQNILRAIGFEVKLKPYITRADGSSKGDWDVGITIDAIEYAPNVDTVILASGDGDFALLLEKIERDFDATTKVYGVEQCTAQSLRQAAGCFVPIAGEFLLGRR